MHAAVVELETWYVFGSECAGWLSAYGWLNRVNGAERTSNNERKPFSKNIGLTDEQRKRNCGFVRIRRKDMSWRGVRKKLVGSLHVGGAQVRCEDSGV